MTGLPRQRKVWTETAGKAVIRARADDRCEGCATGSTLEASHRIARGRCGTWAPSNLLLLCHRCHQEWAGQHQFDARVLGWFVYTDHVPAEVPVWRIHPYAGWWLLDDEGSATAVSAWEPHVPPHPVLPEWAVYAASVLDPWWASQREKARTTP
jgi:hypothetical protein